MAQNVNSIERLGAAIIDHRHELSVAMLNLQLYSGLEIMFRFINTNKNTNTGKPKNPDSASSIFTSMLSSINRHGGFKFTVRAEMKEIGYFDGVLSLTDPNEWEMMENETEYIDPITFLGHIFYKTQTNLTNKYYPIHEVVGGFLNVYSASFFNKCIINELYSAVEFNNKGEFTFYHWADPYKSIADKVNEQKAVEKCILEYCRRSKNNKIIKIVAEVINRPDALKERNIQRQIQEDQGQIYGGGKKRVVKNRLGR
jgi:hypothetical protein